jgi:ubiquinone/menaquinone biosynthesis C-methylase UbiE
MHPPPATSLPAQPVGDNSWDRQLAPFIGSGTADEGPATWRHFCDGLHTRLLERWLPPKGRWALKTDLFDEAAGAGLAGPLAQRAEHVVGIDISMVVARAAAERDVGVTAVLCDVRRLAFADRSFDIVVSNSTLDHFTHRSDIALALAELHRVTQTGGVAVVTLDNPRHPLVALRSVLPGRLLRRLGLQPYFVGATMSLPKLVSTLEALGWEVTHTTTLMHTLRVAAIAASSRLDRAGPSAASLRRWLTSAMRACEVLHHLPTRQLTGHFIAVRAVRA